MLSAMNSGFPPVRACRSAASMPSAPTARSHCATLPPLSPVSSHRLLAWPRASPAMTSAASDP